MKTDDDTVLSMDRLGMLIRKLEKQEEDYGEVVRGKIFCNHKTDPVLRPSDPKPYWVLFKFCCILIFHILIIFIPGKDR